MIWAMPKISIVILAHKDRGWLDDAIISAKSQIYKDYEIILSSDGNPSLKEYADHYGIGFCLNMPEKNYSAALNNAVHQAKGEWIKCVDDDDMLTPYALSLLSQYTEYGDLVYGNSFYIRDDEIKRFHRAPASVSIKDFLPIVTNPLHWSTVLFNREKFIQSGGFDENITYSDEYEFYLNTISKGWKYVNCDAAICYYRLHDQQKTCTIRPMREEEIPYLKEKYKCLL